MTKQLLVVVAVLGVIGASLAGQAKPSIQGVWRVVEVTVTTPTPAPGARSKGTYTDLQPGLLIFTGKHYSVLTDTAVKPRPKDGFKVAGKPTAEEMQSQWGPFAANSGTYELNGNILTRRAIVAKNPAQQAKEAFTRYSIRLEGSNLWVTTIENLNGKIPDGVTVKYVRVE